MVRWLRVKSVKGYIRPATVQARVGDALRGDLKQNE